MTTDKQSWGDHPRAPGATVVLVVDDDVRISRVVAEVAEALGLDPIVASTLAEAKAVFDATVPDIILADVDLASDGGGGFELLAFCQAGSPPFDGRFVFVTGHDAPTIQAESTARFGIAPPVLCKPFTVREFARVVLRGE